MLTWGGWRVILANARIRAAVLLQVDAALIVASLFLALALRFDGAPPREWLQAAWALWPAWVAARLLLGVSFRLYRWSFWAPGLAEASQVCLANLLGTAALIPLSLWLHPRGLPRSVYALELFFTIALTGGLRFGPRLARRWSVERRRARAGAARTLIAGAGTVGDLLVRDILNSPSHPYHVVGYVDDDRRKVGTSLNGRRVLGTLDDLPRLAARHRVSTVLLAISGLHQRRIREVLQRCSHLSLQYKIVPGSLAKTDKRLTAAMLNDLSAEDLLPRDPVSFDREEIRRHVAGRRILVTGAGGSIGGEIARQLAEYGPARLVLLDLNENELYLLCRALQAKHPGLDIHPVVASIRDEARIQALGREHRPEHVFHAAAHKHVPLMEDAPEEALKNNVLGTLHVARMADAVGAERFMLISTDKAVRPTSVMGASKRAAELVIRALAEQSRTQFTAVRFGNVLGSAGSVLPLFKQQIRGGGPITVTHPDCTRYFMTISEAVGLVLLAGLGGYGQLCVLEMGEPIRIAEFAAHLVTLAGLVPGRDINIVYTGLRPGEKLSEDLLTEEEERSQFVRNGIRVACPVPPPPQALELVEALGSALADGDRERAMHLLRLLVPSYQPPAYAGNPQAALPRAPGPVVGLAPAAPATTVSMGAP
jgi:FlaA1/EpsC-like NDP-sugar epimerase